MDQEDAEDLMELDGHPRRTDMSWRKNAESVVKQILQKKVRFDKRRMWLTSRGEILRPKHFVSDHLINTIRFLDRKNQEMNIDSESKAGFSMAPWDRFPIYTMLCREADRRGLGTFHPGLKRLKPVKKMREKPSEETLKVSRKGKQVILQINTSKVGHNTSDLGLRFYLELDDVLDLVDRIGDVVSGMRT